jgi:hypothetical protein
VLRLRLMRQAQVAPHSHPRSPPPHRRFLEIRETPGQFDLWVKSGAASFPDLAGLCPEEQPKGEQQQQEQGQGQEQRGTRRQARK